MLYALCSMLKRPQITQIYTDFFFMLFMSFMVRKVILCALWFFSVSSVVRKLGEGNRESRESAQIKATDY